MTTHKEIALIPNEAAPIAPAENALPPLDNFPIVGIGASAGGLAAFEAFFSGMPADTNPNMAFVLVQHLAPDHKSILTDLIRRYTRMQVFEVKDGMVVQPNCAYIIPPNRDMLFVNGALQLIEPIAPRGQRLPIDYFFRSLALDQHSKAIGIVLSGTGSDGTLGVRAIKGEGGLVMAQTPDSTEYDGMPRSAIATGLVDYELPPAEMPAQLIAYVVHAFSRPRNSGTLLAPHTDRALQKIFALLRAQTGHDFSQYKPSTIHRRIERRMAVHQVDNLYSYVTQLQQIPAEVEALFRDLLIGVTNFFRDPAAFNYIQETVIPALFVNRSPDTPIRIWVTGCSTGEEAYSLAMLLAEQQETQRQRVRIQIFATDIDSQAIAFARAGVYPASIAVDLSPERLERFFTLEPGGDAYRIHKTVRDLLIFSPHSLIKDPPFSKLDLISCRNLLIYLGAELQKKLIPLFHYALKPGGTLVLGTSETVGEFHDLFGVLNRKQKIYRRQNDHFGALRPSLERFLPPMLAADAVAHQSPPPAKPTASALPSLRDMTEQALLQAVTLAAALVNAQGDILYLHGRSGQYLEPTPGEIGVNNLLKMAREGLRHELTLALHQAVETRETVRRSGLRVKTNGDFIRVDLSIRQVMTTATFSNDVLLYLVILEPTPTVAAATLAMASSENAAANTELNTNVDARIVALKQELHAKEEFLQTSNEELETINEELKSSNEEMQSVNEELQSTNEELETSKEELQSVNEELATVNAELQNRVADLSRANNDMNNLLAGTGIGTIYVDHQLRILRFTPAATQIINLILSDIGRPVGHILSNLVGYDRLVTDTQAVLDSLIPRELEVQTTTGVWYALRIHPYRTLENVIEGAVITFVDLTEIVQARESLRQSNDMLRLAVIVRDAHDAITMQDLEGQILAWNPGAVRLYGWSEAEALRMNARERIPVARRADDLARMPPLHPIGKLEPFCSQRLTKEGSILEVWISATALINEAGLVYALATTEWAR
ncbi:chemotaxis protein CheR [Chromatium okenii]|uniref:chemotaxis protein CheB n=1 Tax=Chromatium okenii TaxID=61644 RepID=UPI0019069711|nr:chemotaxis protein CheB [Chromatium okenii]MBK1642126.1 chemotaxis protein CheR [Chromatium okenii]